MASSKTWEPDDIRRNARSWTLEGDAKLLELMQSISQNLEKRANQTTSNMSKLILDIDRSTVALGNATNELSALQHSQFVENRVYEDDETITNEAEVPVNEEIGNNNYNPLETLNTVLKNSISMMDQSYEKISIDIEDSDEEEESSKSVVYRSKNPYEQRLLPFLIGSKEWTEKWHAGLCDSDDDYSDEDNGDLYSDTSENISLPSNAQTISGSDSSVWGLHSNVSPKRKSLDIPSSDEEISPNTFTSKTSSDENRNVMRVPIAHDILKQNENILKNKYYIHKPKNKGIFDEDSEDSEGEKCKKSKENKRNIVNDTPHNAISNILSDEPPELDEVDKNEKVPTNLFFDSDEDDLPIQPKSVEKSQTHINSAKLSVDNVVKPTSEIIHEKNENTNITRKKPVNLFDDNDFDSFMDELGKKSTKITDKNVIKNLFINNSEDEEDFLTKKNARPQSKSSEGKEILTQKFEKLETKSKQKEDISKDKFLDFPTNTNSLLPKTIIANLFNDEPPDDEFDNLFRTPSVEQNTSKITDKNDSSNISTTSSTVKEIDNIFDDKIEAPKSQNHFKDLFLTDSANEDDEHLWGKDEINSKNNKKHSTKKFVEDDNIFHENERDSYNETLPHRQDPLTESDIQQSIKKSSIEQTKSNIFVRTEKINGNESKNVLPEDLFSNTFENNEDLFKTNKKNAFQIDTRVLKETEKPIHKEELFDKAEHEKKSDVLEDHLQTEKNIAKESKGTESKQELHRKTENENNSNLFQETKPNKSLFEETESENIMGKGTERTESDKLLAMEDTPKFSNKNLLYRTLFDDIPPEDDLFDNSQFNKDKIEKNPNDNISKVDDFPTNINQENFLSSTPGNLTYNAISLFDDIPPDDDFQSTGDPKRLHNIFYDDFSDTIIQKDIPNNISQSNYNIFSDEPPPDNLSVDVPDDSLDVIRNEIINKEDDLGNEHTIPKNKESEISTLPTPIKQKGTIDAQEKITKRQSVSELIKKVKSESQEFVEEKSKPNTAPPRKLNPNLQINVAALLPGAKRPTNKLSQVESSPRTPVKVIQTEEVDTSLKYSHAKDEPNRLSSYNKTRARIQVKRKPSTRKVRRDNYEKSLIENESTVERSNVSNLDQTSLDQSEISSRIDISSTIESNSLFNTLDSSNNSKFESASYLNQEKNISHSTMGGKQNSVLEESDEDNEDWLKREIHRKETYKQAVIESKQQSSVTTLDLNKSFLETASKSVQENKSSHTKKSEKQKSFLEKSDEDDEDWLKSETNKSETLKSNILECNQQSSTSNDLLNQSHENKAKVGPAQSPLFTDDSDDDLFSKVAKLPKGDVVTKSKPKIETTKSSIFSSDDEDDLFSKQPQKNSHLLKQTNSIDKSSNLPIKKTSLRKESTKKGLFDDIDDDDDDLFGSAGTNLKNKGTIGASTISKKMDKKSIKPSEEGFSDNPLADLLNN